MKQRTTTITVPESAVLNGEEEWLNDDLVGISKEACKTANEIIKKIEMAEKYVAKAKEAGATISRSHKIPLLPIHLRSASKSKHLDVTMKNLEAVSSLFEVQQTYIELINQSTKFGREVNIALVAYVEKGYRSQMGSIKKLSDKSEMAISSLVQHANTVLDIQERNSRQILFSIILSAVSLLIAALSLVFVFVN